MCTADKKLHRVLVIFSLSLMVFTGKAEAHRDDYLDETVFS